MSRIPRFVTQLPAGVTNLRATSSPGLGASRDAGRGSTSLVGTAETSGERFGHDFAQVQVHSPYTGNSLEPQPSDTAVAGRLIGRPDDPLEQEADRVSERLVMGPVGSVPVVPEETGASSPATGTSALIGTERPFGSGQPLPRSIRFDMERQLGFNFGRVRVHADKQAARLAAAAGAAAFTLGEEIAFDHGRYAPGTSAGRRLIAHELVHVVQQSKGRGISSAQFRSSRFDIGTLCFHRQCGRTR